MNRTLSQLLRVVIQNNLKSWEECFPFIKFAYNRAINSTNNVSPFEIVYGFNSLTHIDLIPLLLEEMVILDGEKKTKMVRQIQEKFQLQIKKRNILHISKANKGCKQVIFQPSD
jgi:hypothetical protein